MPGNRKRESKGSEPRWDVRIHQHFRYKGAEGSLSREAGGQASRKMPEVAAGNQHSFLGWGGALGVRINSLLELPACVNIKQGCPQ